jgi:hypothetical protein
MGRRRPWSSYPHRCMAVTTEAVTTEAVTAVITDTVTDISAVPEGHQGPVESGKRFSRCSPMAMTMICRAFEAK